MNEGTMMEMDVAPSFLCPNAFFSTKFTFVCPGMGGIDVVAHEWGHGEQ